MDLEGYDVPEHDTCALFERLDAFARAKVEAAAREAANTALPRMKDRFNDVRLLATSPHEAAAMLRRPHCMYQAVAPGVSSGCCVSSVPSAGTPWRGQACCPEAADAAQVFSKDEAGMLRAWGPRANIPAVNQKAREAASQLLAQLAVLRTDSKQVKLAWRCCLLSLQQGLCML